MGTKELLLIRHGQGDHNKLFYENKKKEGLALRDPALNEVGIKQAASLGIALKKRLLESKFDLELIVSSPMRRALMTTDHVFGEFPSYPVIVSPIPTEMGHGGCDYGSNKTIITRDFPHRDFSLVLSEEWWTELETQEHLEQRVEEFKEFLNSRPETRIAVVSHGRFLTQLVEIDEFCAFANCDCKQYTLSTDGTISDSEAIFIRVDEAWAGNKPWN